MSQSNDGKRLYRTLNHLDVVEVGMAEYHDETLPEPDSEFQKVNIHPKAKRFANSLNFIFRKPSLGFYMLVRTKLIKALDGNLIDERYFGYASSPLHNIELTEEDSKLMRLEPNLGFRKISEEIISSLVFPSLGSSDKPDVD